MKLRIILLRFRAGLVAQAPGQRGQSRTMTHLTRQGCPIKRKDDIEADRLRKSEFGQNERKRDRVGGDGRIRREVVKERFVRFGETRFGSEMRLKSVSLLGFFVSIASQFWPLPSQSRLKITREFWQDARPPPPGFRPSCRSKTGPSANPSSGRDKTTIPERQRPRPPGSGAS